MDTCCDWCGGVIEEGQAVIYERNALYPCVVLIYCSQECYNDSERFAIIINGVLGADAKEEEEW